MITELTTYILLFVLSGIYWVKYATGWIDAYSIFLLLGGYGMLLYIQEHPHTNTQQKNNKNR